MSLKKVAVPHIKSSKRKQEVDKISKKIIQQPTGEREDYSDSSFVFKGLIKIKLLKYSTYGRDFYYPTCFLGECFRDLQGRTAYRKDRVGNSLRVCISERTLKIMRKLQFLDIEIETIKKRPKNLVRRVLPEDREYAHWEIQ